MYKPGLEDFKQLAAEAGLIPVCREIVADLDTPLTVFAKLAGDESHAFLLESLEGGETWGRYSFVGYDPLMTFESQGKSIKVKQGGQVTELSGDPLEERREGARRGRRAEADQPGPAAPRARREGGPAAARARHRPSRHGAKALSRVRRQHPSAARSLGRRW